MSHETKRHFHKHSRVVTYRYAGHPDPGNHFSRHYVDDRGEGMTDNDPDWEICDLWHHVSRGIGKHEIKLSIHKKCTYRLTFCRVCGVSVKFFRKTSNAKGLVK